MPTKIKANGKNMAEFTTAELAAELDKAPSKAHHKARMESIKRGLMPADGVVQKVVAVEEVAEEVAE